MARWSVGNVVHGPQTRMWGKALAASGPKNAPQRPLGETDRAGARRRAIMAREWSEVSAVGSPVREKWAGDGRGRLGCCRGKAQAWVRRDEARQSGLRDERGARTREGGEAGARPKPGVVSFMDSSPRDSTCASLCSCHVLPIVNQNGRGKCPSLGLIVGRKFCSLLRL